MRALIFREDSIGMALSKSCLAREGGCPFCLWGRQEAAANPSVTDKEKRRQSGDGGEVETVTAEIPVDILRRISPLCEKMGLTIKCYVCYVITLMLCFIYFQRFSVKSWLGYLSGTRVLAAWMNCLEGAKRSSCGSLKVEIRSGKNHFFKTLITLWQKVTHWLNASQNDRKSKGFAFKTPGAALTIQRSAAAAEFAAAVDFVKL